jgi:hypothetical protein
MEPIMQNHRTLAIIALSSILLFPIAAQANNTAEKPVQFGVEKASVSFNHNDTKAVKFVETDQLQTIPASTRQDIRKPSTLEAADTKTDIALKAVKGENRNFYFNHYVNDSELTLVDTRVDVIDTYSYEYNGCIYTNKVVK